MYIQRKGSLYSCHGCELAAEYKTQYENANVKY